MDLEMLAIERQGFVDGLNDKKTWLYRLNDPTTVPDFNGLKFQTGRLTVAAGPFPFMALGVCRKSAENHLLDRQQASITPGPLYLPGSVSRF
jgi:hypothetical protein